ncbi:SH2 domain-containing protein 3C-like isoform X1 [Arapaima gigas]
MQSELFLVTDTGSRIDALIKHPCVSRTTLWWNSHSRSVKYQKTKVHSEPSQSQPDAMSKRKLSFKWFGSITSLSFRRSTEKSEPKLVTKHHGSLCETSTGEKSIDDMDMCPRSPGYARSSDMYTHMGTMPRFLLRKKDKSSKGSTKSKGKSEACKGQSQRQAPDYVCDSPLLSVLSGQGLEALDQQQKQSIPTPEMAAPTQGATITENSFDGQHTPHVNSPPEIVPSESPPPLKSATLPLFPETHQNTVQTLAYPTSPDPNPGPSSPTLDTDTLKTINKVCGQRTCEDSQLGTLPSLPLKKISCGSLRHAESQPSEADTHNQKRHDLLQETQEIHAVDSNLDPMDGKGDYVKFSKEKYLLDSPPEKLRRELEEELKLSSTDLRSHGWYHGPIPREVSETLVLRNGDFLVRDSLANPGDYVLTSRWDNEVLHFRISKVLVKSSDSRVQYLLERESFDSVPALVRFFVSSRRPVSQQSSAQIYCPVNRTLPLRYLEASFSLANGRHGSAHSPSSQRGAYIKRRSVTMTDGLTTEKIIPHRESCSEVAGGTASSFPGSGSEVILGKSPSTVHHKDAMRNCALSMDQIQEFRCPLSPVGETPLSPAYSSITKHRSPLDGKVLGVVPSSPVLRRSSEPQLSPSSSGNMPCPEPAPSTHSTPAHGYLSEGAGGSYCELRPNPAPSPAPPPKSYVDRLRVEEGRGPSSSREEASEPFVVPVLETSSIFKPGQYQSALMPSENKPLEMSILKRVKELLAEVDPKTAAKHITKADCTVARILGVTKEMQKMMGVASGLELLTLPHGHQLRLDLLERFYTMSIMMAVDLLGCTGSTEERAALLHKTIQLAAELKSSLGNMFGFAAVMRALELPQISRLEQTWIALRQRHTEGAILYEKKLKPFLKNMNDGKESCVLSNTSFPHIVPLLSLLEKGVGGTGSEGLEPWESTETGVDVVLNHLEAARTIAHHGGIYHTNAETKLQGFHERPEVLEIFCTEFQMRLLWGSRGAEGSQTERYEKFDKVLTALSNKLEPPVRHSEL